MKAKHISYTQLSSNIAFSLAFVVLLNRFLHVQTVNAYIGSIASSNCDPNGSKYSLECNNDVNSNKTGDKFMASATNRSGKFLFDTLFNINTPLADDDSDDDDDDDVKTCNCEKSGCGYTNKEIRIVGGRPTGINQYPWIARLVYDGHFHCGASLISPNYVLTAAHCVRRLKRTKIRVILGDHDQTITSDSEAKMRAVSAIIRHRNFDGNTYNHDIALLKLRKPVTFTKNILPVCLPADESDPSGKTGIAVGWGRTSEGGALPGVVQHVEVPILTLNQCRSMKYRSSRITPNMVCAGKGKQDSCQGDSGGPLLVFNNDKFEIAGIVSWGVGCGRAGYPGVYTRVSRYMAWLRANVDGCICNNR